MLFDQELAHSAPVIIRDVPSAEARFRLQSLRGDGNLQVTILAVSPSEMVERPTQLGTHRVKDTPPRPSDCVA